MNEPEQDVDPILKSEPTNRSDLEGQTPTLDGPVNARLRKTRFESGTIAAPSQIAFASEKPTARFRGIPASAVIACR